MTAPSKMGRKYELNSISCRRDRARPCPQQILYKIKSTDSRKGCPYGCANILISYQPQIVINQRQSNGGSKPPPYTVKLNFRIYIRLLSNFIIYATRRGDLRSPANS